MQFRPCLLYTSTLDLVVLVTTYFRENAVQFFITVGIPYLPVLLQLIQRRLRQEYMSLLDQLRHKPIDESQQKSTDMRTVYILSLIHI